MDGSPLTLGAIGFVQHIDEADTLAGRQVVGRRQVAEQLVVVDCLEPFPVMCFISTCPTLCTTMMILSFM